MESTENPYAAPLNKDSGEHISLPEDVAFRVEGNVVYSHSELDIRNLCFWTGTTEVQRRTGRRMIVDLTLIDRLSFLLIPWCLSALALSVVVSHAGRYLVGVMVVVALILGGIAWVIVFFRGPQVTIIHGLPRRAPVTSAPILLASFVVGLMVMAMALSGSGLRLTSLQDWLSRVNFPAAFFASALCFLLIRWRFRRPLSASKTADNTFRIRGLPIPLVRALNELQIQTSR